MITPASAPPPALPAPVTAAKAAHKKERSPEYLYAKNLRLVGLCLSRFSSLTGPDREDAQTAGLLGLWSAACRFDPAKGFRFSTYATDTIRGFILRHLRKEREQRRLSCVSLDTPIGDTDSGSELADVVADPQAQKPGQSLLDEAGFEALLARLPASRGQETQRAVLRAVYEEDAALPDVADAWGISRQRVHQVHAAALEALRKQQRASGGRA